MSTLEIMEHMSEIIRIQNKIILDQMKLLLMHEIIDEEEAESTNKIIKEAETWIS